METRNKIKVLIRIFIGICLLLFLIYKLPTNEIYNTLSSIIINWYFLGIFILIPFCFLKCLRWKYLLFGMGVDISIRELLIIFFKGLFLGLITPGRLGELGKAWFLKDKGTDIVYKGLASLLVDRLLDVVMLFSFAVFGLFIYRDIIAPNIFLSILISFMILFLFSILFYFVNTQKKIKCYLSSKLSRFTPEKIFTKVTILWNGFSTLNSKVLIISIFISLVTQLIWGGIGYALLVSLGSSVSFWWLLWCMSIVAILNLLPISYMGIGVRESAFVFFFILKGYEGAIGLSFGFLVTSLWIWVGMMGLLVWGIDNIYGSQFSISNLENKCQPGE